MIEIPLCQRAAWNQLNQCSTENAKENLLPNKGCWGGNGGDLQQQRVFPCFGALDVVVVLIARVGGVLSVDSICEST